MELGGTMSRRSNLLFSVLDSQKNKQKKNTCAQLHLPESLTDYCSIHLVNSSHWVFFFYMHATHLLKEASLTQASSFLLCSHCLSSDTKLMKVDERKGRRRGGGGESQSREKVLRNERELVSPEGGFPSRLACEANVPE